MRNDATTRLTALHVADVMTSTVTSVAANSRMADAAKQMMEQRISGAPVLNEQNKFVGILSASDFVRKAWLDSGHESPEMIERLQRMRELEWGQEWLQPGSSVQELVGFHMTPAVQGVPATATLFQAAQVMCSLHVHRLPVLDGRGDLCGMITSLDIVAALLNAIDEARQTRP